MIAWFTKNGVAANLLMLLLVIGGVAALSNIKKELFPEFSLDTVLINVPYLGASPEEVEEGVILRIEEALEGMNGVKEINASATEGYGSVAITVDKGYELSKLKEETKSRIDAITTFPQETERPIIEELLIQKDVLRIGISGNTDEKNLKKLAERIRDDLVKLPGISQAFVQGVRDYEISIDVSERDLQRYGLTFSDVVYAIRTNSFDLPGGLIKAEGGEILLRTKEQAYTHDDFVELPLITDAHGTQLKLGDVATIRDEFTENELISKFNNKPCALVLVREVGNENPLEISKTVRNYLEEAKATWLPRGIEVEPWADLSFYLQGRLDLLIENGTIGFILVLLSLTIFLRPSLAIFVAIGIPVSFLGTFMIAPFIGLSINLISLFAFILVLGIVVDDAIVIGESVFTEFQKKGPGVESAIRGTHAVSTPVTFSVLTTIVGFTPIFFLPGLMGKFFLTIPLVVIPTLLFSLLQSKLVLPYHLSLCHVGDKKRRDELGFLSRCQRRITDALERFTYQTYGPMLEKLLHYRYTTVAIFIALFILSIALVMGNIVRFVQFPNVPSDYILVELTMPEGSPISETKKAMQRIENALQEISDEEIAKGGIDPIKHKGIFVGFSTMGGGPEVTTTKSGNHIGSMILELSKSELRDSDAFEIVKRWREKVGEIPGARRLLFEANASGPTGLPVDIRLTGADFKQLKAASREIQQELAQFDGLHDIRDTYSEGKTEIKLRLKESALNMGLKASDLALQVRQAFYGAEAQRIQRGRDDVRVMVRFPEEERSNLASFETMHIRTPAGTEIPISEVAELEWGSGYPSITRMDRQRVLNVQADADKEVADLQEINKILYGDKNPFTEIGKTGLIEKILKKYPGVVSVKSGEAKDWDEMKPALASGFMVVLIMIYMLLAIPFKSYLQPLIVISVIPFGVAGAIYGHLITCQDLSILSFLGIIALIGVVVNDSLVLVDYINKLRQEGVPLHEAVSRGSTARFRPIILTSITTFVGLIPILLEKSLQAQFLIPMATSLAFGVLFATFITLLLVPAIYLMIEDLLKLRKRFH